MGCYYPEGYLKFDGSSCEKKMMKRLLQLMNPRNPDYEWKLPLAFCDYCDYPTAFLGILKEDGNYDRFIEIDSQLTPKLIAALFPVSTFLYSITLWHSNSNENIECLTVEYKNGKLMIRESYYYDLKGRHAKYADEKCRELLDKDPTLWDKYEECLKEYGITGAPDDEYGWINVLDELTGDAIKCIDSLYDFQEEIPARNAKYEQSFFGDGDLQEFLVGEQIKEKDISLIEYIKSCKFSKSQLQSFKYISDACQFDEMSRFLLEEELRRFPNSATLDKDFGADVEEEQNNSDSEKWWKFIRIAGEQKQIEVVRYFGTESVVKIPESIQSYTVTQIGYNYHQFRPIVSLYPFSYNVWATRAGGIDSWFNDGDTSGIETGEPIFESESGARRNVKKVVLPKTLFGIGNIVFSECENLQEIMLPDGLEVIGERAFEGCKSLSEIRIPASVKYIGENAFALYSRDELREYASRKENIDSTREELKKMERQINPNFKIIAQAGSVAAAYAIEKGISWSYQ